MRANGAICLGRGPFRCWFFVFVCFFSFPQFLLVLFRSQFSLVFHVFTGLDVCSNLKYVQFQKKKLIFEFLFRFENCSNSKIVQMQILFKFEFCSNSIYCSSSVFCSNSIYCSSSFFCSNLKFVQIKICSYSKFIQILILFTNLFKIWIFRK
jgi:hypothetical protein